MIIFFKKHVSSIVRGSIFLLLMLLLARSPFSERNLIANFEPFPDAYHYIVSARNLLHGHGLSMWREGGSFWWPSVPPLYSLALLPSLALWNDARAFYFSNLVLSALSFWLLVIFLKKMKVGLVAEAAALIIYVTSFVTYWYPSLAMAENLIQPIFLGFCVLLLNKPTKAKTMLAALAAASFYYVKYACGPLTAVAVLAYLFMILKEVRVKRERLSLVITFLIVFSTLFGGLILYEQSTKGSTLFGAVQKINRAVFQLPKPIVPVMPSKNGKVEATAPVFFSANFVELNVEQYIGWMRGGYVSYLWFWVQLFPVGILVLAWVGFWLSTIRKRGTVSLWLAIFVWAQIIFMSFFYVVDGRYLSILLPLVTVWFAVTVEYVLTVKRKDIKLIGILLLCLACAQWVKPTAIAVKKQIMLNLKYAEQPWWYISANHSLNVMQQDAGGHKAYLITVMAPYAYDFLERKNVALLPLSRYQEFGYQRDVVWNLPFDQDLIELYTSLLKNGEKVYLTNSHSDRYPLIEMDFKFLLKTFQITKIADGCHDWCNVYRVELKISPVNQKK